MPMTVLWFFLLGVARARCAPSFGDGPPKSAMVPLPPLGFQRAMSGPRSLGSLR